MKTIELPNITKIESLSTETGISAEDIVEFNVLYNLIPESAKLQEGLPGKFDSVLDTKAQKPATSAIGKWIQQRISFGDSPRKQLFDKAALVIAQFDWGGPELSEESKKVVAAFSGAARDKMAKAATDKAKSLNLGKL